MTIKKNWNNIKTKIKTKWKINDEVILRYEVGVLLVVLLISVTIAWLIRNSGASLTNLNMSTAPLDSYFIVSSDGTEIGDGDEVGLQFNNERQTKLMPGTEGTLNIRVAASKENVTGCTIYLEQLVPTYNDDNLSEELKSDINSTVLSHILFYYPESESDENKYVHPITSSEGLTVSLNQGESKEVTLYWIWPYTYAEIPQVLDPEDEEKNRVYDIEDSKIGEYVKKIAFKFKFESVIQETP